MTFDVADFVESESLVAVIVMVPAEAGAVNWPAGVMVPLVADQLTEPPDKLAVH